MYNAVKANQELKHYEHLVTLCTAMGNKTGARLAQAEWHRLSDMWRMYDANCF